MGQKINPISMRVAVNKDWRSRWFGRKKDFGAMLIEDDKIRRHVKRRLEHAAVPEILIERYANRVRVNICTARPGIVIGRKGQDIETIRTELAKMTGKEVYIEIHEIRHPDINAQLVAEGIALQLERRVMFRRAMKRAIKLAMDMGVLGIKVRASGRLGGNEIARVDWAKEGKIPLHTFKENVDYGFAEAGTKAGRIGVKVWICKTEDEVQNLRRGARTNAAHA